MSRSFVAGKIPVVICLDVEPDERVFDPLSRPDWTGFEKTWEYFSNFRPHLERATGSPVHFSWFFRMDPQVEYVYGSASWVMARYPRIVRELQVSGDEPGLHPHSWRWDETAQEWIADFSNQPWIEHCVRQSFAAFEECFRRPCGSLRFGDRWMNDATLALAEKLGARFDLTIEPGRKPERLIESFTGSLPDYTHAPRRPYRPSRNNFQKSAGWWRRKMWMLPVSTAKPGWAAAIGEEQNSSAIPKVMDEQEIEPTPVYEGWHDRADHQVIAGWIYDAVHPDGVIAVDIYADAAHLATAAARLFRPDLQVAGKGNGRHAFVFPLPDRLRDGQPHTIRVKVAGTDFELNDTPKEICCLPPDDPVDEYVTLNLGESSQLICNLMETLLLNEHPRPYLALVMRCDAPLHRDRRINLEQNLGYITSHPLVSRLVIATPGEAVKIMG